MGAPSQETTVVRPGCVNLQSLIGPRVQRNAKSISFRALWSSVQYEFLCKNISLD